jgi:uncharacterized protein
VSDRMIPYPDRDSTPWWDALARHELVQQRCSDCGRWRWPPREMCGDCGSFAWSWQPIVDTGEVVSWITTHHAFLPGFTAPYHTVFVRLHLEPGSGQDDLIVPGSWSGEGAPETGMVVRAHFDDIPQGDGEHVTLLGWEPAASPASTSTS